MRNSTLTATLLTLFTITLCLCESALAQAGPGTTSEWQGYRRQDFQVDGRNCYIVAPEHIAAGKPWVWRARFPNYHPDADALLLERGFHVAFMDTNGMLGSPRAMKHWDAFYQHMIGLGFSPRVALYGVSRGGLFVYGFASRHPERVACVYADVPVCDLKSWPGAKGERHGRGDADTWRAMRTEYGFTEAQALAYRGNAIDTLAPIAKAKIPILHIVSRNDQVVPPSENTFLLAKRLRALGGNMRILELAEGTKASHGHHFAHPAYMQVADFIERHAAALPKTSDYTVYRDPLQNCRITFEQTKHGRVAFLGGSITQNPGWRDMTKAYLRLRFPNTTFAFVDAGISSTGSTPGAFRLQRDVLSKGKVDLLFEEAAVNDLHNMRSNLEMTRAMEGIIRHARASNPAMDIVVMHFAEPRHMAKYRAGKTPNVITQHEAAASHHGVTTIHLAREVTERIDAGQFTWQHDFRNLHPSPYGQRLYASTIRRALSAAWSVHDGNADQVVTAHQQRDAIDAFSYDSAKMLSPAAVHQRTGFEVVARCDPRTSNVGGGVRSGFVNVPMLVGTQPGDAFELPFQGRAVGLFVVAGPDAGIIEYRLDDGPWQAHDLFTKWSRGLHIPWAYVLEAELTSGPHKLAVRIADAKHAASKGHACRIVHLLVNEAP